MASTVQFPKRTTTPTITKKQYYRLMGLIALGEKYTKLIDELVKTALEITNEIDFDGKPEPYGHTADAICSEYSVDRLLDVLGIEVMENSNEKSKELERENQPLADPA